VPDSEAWVPPLHGRRVRLTSLTPSDYPVFSQMEQDYDDSVLYRHRGVSVPPENFSETLWRNVLVNFAVRRQDSPVPIGLVTCYGADFRSDIASISMNIAPEWRRHGYAGEAGELFVDYLFASFPFRKLYGQVAGWAAAGSGVARGGVFVEEGCLREHEYHNGVYYDMYTYALYRAQWERHRADRRRKTRAFIDHHRPMMSASFEAQPQPIPSRLQAGQNG
jgi:hypothetical protein